MTFNVLALVLSSHIGGIDLTDLSAFCVTHREAVACENHHQGRTLSLAEVVRVDREIRKHFVYKDTAVRTNIGHTGNCADYSLILSEALAKAGEDSGNITMMFMVQCDKGPTPDCDGHVRLWVKTSDHGLTEVDNMHAPAPAWHDAVYVGFMIEDGQELVHPVKGYHRDLVGLESD